jgi:hypothetical protein
MLDDLPNLPQLRSLRRVKEQLDANPDVKAIWLGGSFAAGNADRFSDVDLRVAVAAERLKRWRAPEWPSILGQEPLGQTFLAFGNDAFLHHLVLADGTIFDLFVQSTARDNPERDVKVLACRDAAFGDRLARFAGAAHAALSGPAETAAVAQVVVDFWINSHKHRKVLGRGLTLLAAVGVQLERMSLLRLWQVLLTGHDAGGRPTIHGLSAGTREVERGLGAAALETFGLPLRTAGEISTAVERNRDEVARVGRKLAARLAFAYPEALEQAVRDAWAAASHR